MNTTGFLELGTIIRSHGIKGDIVIYITTDDRKQFNNLKKIWIENTQDLSEMEVTAMRFKDNQATLHLKGIEDRNTSDLLIRKKIYIKTEDLPDPGNDFYFHEIIGYTIDDKNLGVIGAIEDVAELPQHAIFTIKHQGKEVLIPASHDFILKIDRKKKTIYMDLPEGLMDIYL